MLVKFSFPLSLNGDRAPQLKANVRHLSVAVKAECYTSFVDCEWDEEKAAGNLEKHGVSFEKAATVFGDPLYNDFYDPDHSVDEHRYLIIGTSTPDRLLIVSYTERDDVV